MEHTVEHITLAKCFTSLGLKQILNLMNSENKNKYEELVKADYGIEFQNESEKEEIIKSLIAFSEIIYNISKNENHQLRIVSNNNNITQLKQAA